MVRATRVRLEPGRLRLGPGDWEAQGVVAPRDVVVSRAYWLDADEVTEHRWAACALQGACEPRTAPREPGQPVRGVTFAQAQTFCAHEKGTLPSEDEWLLAAAGPRARRYAWGDTGAVCRRTSWGLATGPCATNGSGPELAGLHDDDKTPDGIYDLTGNVSEWVVASNGAVAVRGGSWRSMFAAELRTWRRQERDGTLGWDDVGFRCRYDDAGAPPIRVVPSAPP